MRSYLTTQDNLCYWALNITLSGYWLIKFTLADTMYGNMQLTLGTLRLQYWIVRGRVAQLLNNATNALFTHVKRALQLLPMQRRTKNFEFKYQIKKTYQFSSINSNFPQFCMISHAYYRNLVLICPKLRVRFPEPILPIWMHAILGLAGS